MTHDDHDSPAFDSHEPSEPLVPLAPLDPASLPALADREMLEAPPLDGITLPIVAPPVPDDLRVPWGWPSLLLLILAALVATVVIQLLLVLGLTLRGIPLARLQDNS